jgi:hypothetical protein
VRHLRPQAVGSPGAPPVSAIKVPMRLPPKSALSKHRKSPFPDINAVEVPPSIAVEDVLSPSSGMMGEAPLPIAAGTDTVDFAQEISGPPPNIAHMTVESTYAANRQLDVQTVQQATNATSQEIELGKALTVLMTNLLQLSGAESGLLVSRHNGQWAVEARADKDGCSITDPDDDLDAQLPADTQYSGQSSVRTTQSTGTNTRGSQSSQDDNKSLGSRTLHQDLPLSLFNFVVHKQVR